MRRMLQRFVGSLLLVAVIFGLLLVVFRIRFIVSKFMSFTSFGRFIPKLLFPLV